jgi:hypothetical protein
MGNCFLYKRGGGFGGAIPDIVKVALGKIIFLSDSKDAKLKGLRVFGKTIQNGTPTPDAPVPLESVGDGGSVGVMVCSKNLLQNTAVSKIVNGVDFVVNPDGSVLVNGTANARTFFTLIGEINKILPKGTYRVTGCPKGTTGISLVDSYTGSFHESGNGSTLIINTSRRDVSIRVESGAVCNNVLIKPMVSTDLSVTYNDFEPYKELQTLTIQKPADVPVFLPGIPVSSGGNYVDENGQQWICDEVDFAQGKYVQRITKLDITNYSDINVGVSAVGVRYMDVRKRKTDAFAYDAPFLCNCYQPISTSTVGKSGCIRHYANSFTVYDDDFVDIATAKAKLEELGFMCLYQLATPIETPLSTEELAQYATLHTNYPSTTIYNDADAYMEVKYAAIGG